MTIRQDKKIHCLSCKHLGITWNPTTPYFCRAWSIRSKNYPCEEVFSVSSIACQKFEPKPANNTAPPQNKTRKKVRSSFYRRG